MFHPWELHSFLKDKHYNAENLPIRITASQDILTFLPFITIALKSIFNNIIIENIKHIGCINDFERNQTCDNLCMFIHFRKYYTNICKEIIFKFHVRRGKDKGPPP